MRTETLLPKRFPRPLLIGLGAAVLIGAALLALALVLSRPQLARLSPAAELTQVSEGGGVTVKTTWMANQAAPTFAVVLDTHSVALDGYDEVAADDHGHDAASATESRGLALVPVALAPSEELDEYRGKLTFDEAGTYSVSVVLFVLPMAMRM